VEEVPKEQPKVPGPVKPVPVVDPILDTSVVNNNPIPSLESSGFTIYSGFDSTVDVISTQRDGKILAGGYFSNYKGESANKIIRLNPNGSIDNSFIYGSGFNGWVRDIVVQSDGKILICGHFTSYNGVTANRIIRLNPNGSIDNSFTSGEGCNSVAHCIALQPDGKIIIGGVFNAYDGVWTAKIIRLNPDGTNDGTFFVSETTLKNGFNSFVNSILVQPDGKLLIGGAFTSYNGTTANRIIRLNPNGSIDTTFSYGTGFSNEVKSIIKQPDGKLLIGGAFTSYNGTTANRIIRLNPNGSKDASFVYGSGFDSYVNSIYMQSDRKILIGGNFNSYNGVSANKIIRLNPNGYKEDSFVYGTGFNRSVDSILELPNGKILTGGGFTSYNGDIYNRIILLNNNGSSETNS
jgi:uncharacterized delta-60 repeat protein